MTPLVDFARSLALTFAHLTPEDRSSRIQSYLLLGVPHRGAVPMTDEAAHVLRTFERLRAGAPAHRLIAKKELPRCRERAAPQDKAAKELRSRSMVKAWQRRRATAAGLGL